MINKKKEEEREERKKQNEKKCCSGLQAKQKRSNRRFKILSDQINS
jgi:hypothetical protein